MEKYTKSALVTGGAKGIGEAICKRLSRDGFAVAVADLDLVNAKKVADEINNNGGKAIALKLDVSSRKEVTKAVEDTYKAFGDFNVMVNNAGVCLNTPVGEVDEKEYSLILDVNVGGVVWGIQAASNKFRELGHGGRIINATSQAGVDGYPGLPMYCASKFAVRGLTQVAGRDLAPLKINVNAFAPGIVRTPMLEGLAQKVADAAGKDLDWGVDQFVPGIAQGRVSTSEEVAAGVSFLAGPDSEVMIGQTLIIDGGMVFN